MQNIRTLSLWQPWAELVASGQKTIETRQWRSVPFSLMGQRIALHAARKFDPPPLKDLEGWLDRIHALTGHRPKLPADLSTLPSGAVVATARVRDVRWLNGLVDARAALCYCHGLVGIVLADLLRVHPPLEVRGRQGIFILPAAEILRRSTPQIPPHQGT